MPSDLRMGLDSDYRAAFNISPRNDYSTYLLARTGESGDGPNRQAELLPGAPMAHRLRSVAVALPFYYVLPYYAFRNIEAPDEPYLPATADWPSQAGFSCS